MRTFVLGAGTSHPIYPLGGTLLGTIDSFIKSCGKCFDRFDYETAWPATLEWLAKNPNPLLHEAYRAGNIEQIFTVLDLAQSLNEESLFSILKASKKGPTAVALAEEAFNDVKVEFGSYGESQRILLGLWKPIFNIATLKTW